MADVFHNTDLATPALWAGYDHQGNDRAGHMHAHREGTFIGPNLVAGVFCAAPLTWQNGEQVCTDPNPFVDWSKA